jgi:GNAT superfamily N-acetyltransferase
MESTELAAFAIETLPALAADSAAMLDALVVASGWNQTRDDWELFQRQGTVHAVRDAQGRIVASGAVLPLAPRAAWISMILVAPEVRGRGLGRKVFEQCLRTVQADGRTALLDATPAGEKLYTRFGFAPLWQLSRWQRPARDTAAADAASTTGEVDTLAALDTMALGLQRGPMLSQIAARTGSRIVRHAQAFCFVRAGRLARQIGPMLAQDEAHAAALLAEVAATTAQPLFIDVPDDRPRMRRMLEACGFSRARTFTRMALGDDLPKGQNAFIHAIAGPEYG